MKDENHLKHIQDAINALPEEFNILEEQIDINLQMTYFDKAKELRDAEFDESLIDKAKADLYSDEVSLEDKKQLLVQLAGFDDIEAFRVIEAFYKQAPKEIRDWAVLAFQESRMVIQSSLLGEQQVFISTGLGGKGKNIRYSVAMHSTGEGQAFNDTQKKLVKSEFEYFLQKSEGELEEISFEDQYALAVFLFPLKENLHIIFKSFIDECNQFGNFLSEDVIITNVKRLNVEELDEFLKNNDQDEQE
ncbi:hypothetical protein [Sunxiuqinia indica]|uniref:hypothetical protein n=1 Tax=Sunxiuqinia indica TaxID=2692584 RepID=UPI00135CA3E8|nr:hypothetical protein [Sunxiuqinia indica]